MGYVKQTVESTIIKSDLDERLYRSLVLSNDLKVFLISDINTQMSAAALVSCVGYLDDPPKLQGLAHLCQHMILRGSTESPDEYGFVTAVSQYGGKYKSFTDSDRTSFSFKVLPEHLEECLELFSQCIKSPLFTDSTVNSEIIAINNEHEFDLFDDCKRLFNLIKFTADEIHPFSSFDTGNIITLNDIPNSEGINVCDALQDFHAEWYSSNIMSLCILGKESLDDLQDMVIDSFGDIENSDVVVSRWSEHPYGPKQLGLVYYMVPIIPKRQLDVMFPIPDFDEDYKSNPGLYFITVFENERPGSLIYFLRQEDLCENISVESKTFGRGFGFFTIRITLTQEGAINVDKIITVIFQYINMLQEKGPKRDIFEKLRLLKEEEFTYKKETSPLSYVENISNNLHVYPLEEALSGGYYLDDWRPDLIEKFLGYLYPNNARVFVTAREHFYKTDCRDPIFGTNYTFEQMPEDRVDYCKEHALPRFFKPPDRVIPCTRKINVLPLKMEDFPHPIVIEETNFMRVWFKQDSEPFLPKAYFILEFVLNYMKVRSRIFSLSYKFVKLFQSKLHELKQNPEMTAIVCTLKATMTGMVLELNGDNDKLFTFLKRVLDGMTEFELDRTAFDVLEIKKVDASIIHPFVSAEHYMMSLLTQKMRPFDEVEHDNHIVSFKEFEFFVQEMFHQMYLECFLYGDVNRKMALQVVKLLDKSLIIPLGTTQLKPHPHTVLYTSEWELPEDSSFVLKVPFKTCRSSAAGIYYQCAQQDTRSNVLLQLLEHIFKQPFFTMVRKKNNLGYLVKWDAICFKESCGLRIIIETDKNPSFVDENVERFLQSMRSTIRNMTEEEFEIYKEAIIGQKLCEFESLCDSMHQYWKEIKTRQYKFDRRNSEVTELEQVEKRDLVEFYEHWLSFSSLKRRKLAVYVLSDSIDKSDIEYGTGRQIPTVIKDIEEFKKTRTFFPQTLISLKVTTFYERIERDETLSVVERYL